MKLAALAILALGINVAHGATFDFKNKQWSLQKSAPKIADSTTQPPPDEMKPIRIVPMKATITKTTITKLADGTFDYKFDTVCITTGMVRFFDFTSSSGKITISNATAECDSTVGGNPAKVKILSIGVLGNGTVHPDEPSANLKYVTSFAYVEISPTNTPPSTEWINANNFLTRDPDARSMIQSFDQPNWVQCSDPADDSTCAPLRNESFSITAEVIDQP